MRERIQSEVQQHRNQLLNLLQRYVALGRSILQPHHLVDELILHSADKNNTEDIKTTAFGKLIENCQEAIVSPPWVGFAVRPKPGIWEYVRINVEELIVEELSVSEYLGFKEQLIAHLLELDFEPFNAHFPRMTRPSSIGHGVQFLNRLSYSIHQRAWH